MITITIHEFLNYSQSDFLDYLHIENDTHFKIIYPKIFNWPADHKAQLHNNYIMAAYAGQKLSEISTQFGYYVPAPEIQENFYFMVETANWQALSKVLFTIVNQIVFKGKDHFNDFVIELSQFYDKVDQGETSSGSIGLYIIANRFYDQ